VRQSGADGLPAELGGDALEEGAAAFNRYCLRCLQDLL
jgi:hypothetical protein